MRAASESPSTSSIVRKVMPSVLFDGMERHDVRMVECRNGSRFALESGQTLRIAGHRRREHFEGDRAPELRVDRAIHLAHSAGAES